MERLPLEFIEKKMDAIRREYDADPAKYLPVPSALLKFLALADTIKAGCYDTFPKPLTLADVDQMALETLTLTGEITIKEDTPPDKSVGWPGSDEITGEITGRFEVPASVVSLYGNVEYSPKISEDPKKGVYPFPIITIGDYTDWIESYVRETLDLWGKIVDYCDLPDSYKPDIEITGVTKKGDRAVVDFKIVIKES